MTSPSQFRELFAEAHHTPRETLGTWFDQKTARLGGKDAVQAARELAGSSIRFDFHDTGAEIPKIDLPALRPFFLSMLMANGRRYRDDDQELSFKTPERWLDDPGVRTYYEGLVFDRSYRASDAAQRILGVGHRALEQALRQAKGNTASAATMPLDVLPAPLLIFQIHDRVTAMGAAVRVVVAAIEYDLTGTQQCSFLRDWELLEKLNGLNLGQKLRRASASPHAEDRDLVLHAVDEASKTIDRQMQVLNLPFRLPVAELAAVLWPMSATGWERVGDAGLERVMHSVP
jgi:hypothetical protein